LCEWCEKRGILTPAAIVHHAERHDGDINKFTLSPLVSLCKACHDGEAQGVEVRNYSDRIGPDGFFVDPNHPHNRRR